MLLICVCAGDVLICVCVNGMCECISDNLSVLMICIYVCVHVYMC